MKVMVHNIVKNLPMSEQRRQEFKAETEIDQVLVELRKCIENNELPDRKK